MFTGNAWLFAEKTDKEYLKYWSLSWKLQKTKVANLPFFKQINTKNKKKQQQFVKYIPFSNMH